MKLKRLLSLIIVVSLLMTTIKTGSIASNTCTLTNILVDSTTTSTEELTPEPSLELTDTPTPQSTEEQTATPELADTPTPEPTLKPTVTPTPTPPTLISIADAKIMELGSIFKITGIVTKTFDGTTAVLQDSTGGIPIYEEGNTIFETGDEVDVTGMLNVNDDGMLYISPIEKRLITKGQTLPNPFLTSIESLNNGNNQGDLVRLEGVKIISVDAENIVLRDESTNQYIQVNEYFPLNVGIGVNSKVDVIAVASKKLNVPILRTDNSGDIVFTKVPVEIYTEDELDAIRNNMVYNYKLMNDIALTKNWVTVGDNSRKYNGTFDGQEHKITNFNVVLDQEYQFYYAGFIGNLSPMGTIKNLTIEMTPQTGAVRAYNIDDNTYAGGITGVNEGTIENCHVSGNVEGKNYVGGITGLLSGTLNNCTFDGNVKALGNNIGGIAGNSTASIDNCQSKGTVTGINNVGGLVGFTGSSINSITNSSSESCVNGTASVGGLIGNNTMNVNNCYSMCSVAGNTEVGGFIGYNNGGTIQNNHSSYGSVYSNSNVGGFIGNIIAGVIIEDYAENDVCSYGENSGGFAGYTNVNLTNCYAKGRIFTTGGDNIGGLVGTTYNNVVIDNCYATGDIQAKSSNVGGLVGHSGYYWWGATTITNSYSLSDIYTVGSNVGGLLGFSDSYYSGYITISKSYSKGKVTSLGDNVGGLVGFNTSIMTIEKSYTLGDVGGNNNVGGLVGQLSLSESRVTDSYANGNVSGRENVGGFIGYLTTAVIRNNYSTGKVVSTVPTTSGGLVGKNTGISNTIRCYFDAETSGQGDYIKGIPKSTAQMKNPTSYVGWDFAQVWSMTTNVNNGYPVLRNIPSDIDVVKKPVIMIYTAEDLNNVRYRLGERYKLANDITVASEWTPIGTQAQPFFGVFDGDNHKITGINVSINYDNAGFISNTLGALIKNIRIEGIIKGKGNVGGLVGHSASSTIDNCSTTGGVYGSGDNLGGLVGNSIEGTIYDSCSTADVITTAISSNMGGLIGNADSTIDRCFASGNVFGNRLSGSNFGGLVGSTNWKEYWITDSFASGNVLGCNSVGGLVGYSIVTYIKNSYSIGHANAGLIATRYLHYSNWSYYYVGTIISSYWDVQTSATSSSLVGSGKTTDEMKNIATYVGWDFDSVWAISPTINNGYPFLRWRVPVATSVAINAAKTTLYVGEATQYSYTVSPSDAPNLAFWSSSDETVATVNSNGVVIAMKEGKADITVRTGSNVTSSVTVVVLQQQMLGNIIAITPIGNQSVPYGTAMSSVLTMLPDMIEVTLEGGVLATLPIEWSLVEGSTYSFTGNILLLQDSPISNTNNIITTVNIVRQPQPQEIASVESVTTSVTNGTNLANVLSMLPPSVNVTLADSRVVSLSVLWDNGSTPSYRSTTAGDYSFSGTFILPDDGQILNTSSIKAAATITVLPVPPTVKKITGAVTNQAIHVEYGTTLSEAKAMLPQNVYIVLDNIETVAIPVIWSNTTTPDYKQYIAGAYSFTGTIALPDDGFTQNPLNIKSTINVIVDAAISGPKNIIVSNETAKIGDVSDVDIAIDNNMNMTAGSFVIDFDASMITPLEYSIGSMLENTSVMVNINYTDPATNTRKIKVSFVSTTPITLGGDMLSVKFFVNNTVSDNTTITITLKNLDIYDIDENALPCTIIPGSIDAVLITLGDVNGDGKINILDVFRIMMYDSGLVTLTNKQLAAADVDKNGVVDIFDAMKIQRFDVGLSDTLN